MSICRILVALVIGVSVADADETTFKKLLGEEKVKNIVNQVVVDFTKEHNLAYPKITIASLLYERVLSLAGETKIESSESPSRASDRLGEGVAGFFRDYRDYMMLEHKGNQLVLEPEQLDGFFEWLKERKPCGKLPCDIPPCCGNCDNCEGVK